MHALQGAPKHARHGAAIVRGGERDLAAADAVGVGPVELGGGEWHRLPPEHAGAGVAEHFSEIFNSTNISAALAAGIFHRKEVPIQSVKQHLVASSIPCRNVLVEENAI